MNTGYILQTLHRARQKFPVKFAGKTNTTVNLPCFPNNKTGIILIFKPKCTLGLIFGGCPILIYQKMKLQSKI